MRGFICPNCNGKLEFGKKCNCSKPTTFDVLGIVNGKLVCVGYTDHNGNIWRFRTEV